MGSYPGVSNADALAYFGRKYDELAASGLNVHLVGGAFEATELDAKRAIDQASRLAAEV